MTKIKEIILGKNSNAQVTRIVFFLPFLFFITSFILDTPSNLFNGLLLIFTSSARFPTDYFSLAGPGAAFLSASLILFFFAIMMKILKANMGGVAIAAQFMSAGFAFNGKNLANFLPLFIGVFLYSLIHKEKFKNYIFIAMFACCMSPIVSEIYCNETLEIALRIPLSILIGIVVGFITAALAVFTNNVHRGYNLYNVGFAAGLAGFAVVSILKEVGIVFQAGNMWYEESNTFQLIYVGVICLLFILFGILLDKNNFIEGIKISKESGRAVSDYIVKKGVGPTLVNMGLTGILTIIFLLAVQAKLSGGNLMAAIFSVIGFAAFGKNIRNTSFIYLGALVASWLGWFDVSSSLLAFCTLLGTSLSPIGGQFGIIWGVVSIWLHLCLVTKTAPLHGWMLLYNNGFSAGFVALILVPIIESVIGGIKNVKRRKEDS